jgi:NADPH:quinone reductase-like Zn-dependent oxidoreductase
VPVFTVMGPPPASRRQDIRSLFFVRQPSRAQLVEIARRVDAGQLRPPEIGAVYPLAGARKAFTAKSGDKVAGKIILQP